MRFALGLPGDALRSRLEGRWRRVGIVQGDGVQYTRDAARAPDRRYVVLRRWDERRFPEGEARSAEYRVQRR